MKKFLISIGLLAALGFILWPDGASAQAIIDVVPKDPQNVTKGDVADVLVELIRWALMFAAAIGTIFIVINGYQYILSAGNQEKLEKAKMGLTWSIGGLVLVISAYAIVYLVQRVLGSRTTVQAPAVVPGSASTILEQIAQIIFVFGGATAVLFLIVGGYRYMTSQGNRDLVEAAKKTVLYALIGLIVVMISGVIFNLIAETVGSSDRITYELKGGENNNAEHQTNAL